MKIIKGLTVWERSQLVWYIGHPDQRATFEQMRRAIILFDILELSEGEKAEIGWTDEPTFITCSHCQARIQTSSDGAGRWTDTERAWSLEFEDADFKMLEGTTTWNKWPMSAARLLVPMLEKIKEAMAR